MIRAAPLAILSSVPLLLAAAPAPMSLGAHVHGVGALSFAAEGETLFAELHTPLANLVGFEHAPRTDAEREAYRAALDLLSDPETIFDLSPARCALDRVALTEPDFAHDDGDHGHDHAHDRHDHDGAHVHADLRVEYELTCSGLDRLGAVHAALFAHFPGFERIDALWLGERTISARLTPDRPELGLR